MGNTSDHGGRDGWGPDGPIPAERVEEAKTFLNENWRSFFGGKTTSMTGLKGYRAESLRIEGGNIIFDIERHGRTVNGSTRGDVDTWEVDPVEMTARIIAGGVRQLNPMDQPFRKAQALEAAQGVVELLQEGKGKDQRLRPDDVDDIWIAVDDFIPVGRFKQTREGRTQKFIDALNEVLPGSGWDVGKASRWSNIVTFRKASSSG